MTESAGFDWIWFGERRELSESQALAGPGWCHHSVGVLVRDGCASVRPLLPGDRCGSEPRHRVIPRLPRADA